MSRPFGRFAPRLALAVGALLAALIGAMGLAFAEELRRELVADLTRSLITQARLAAGRVGLADALRAGAFEAQAVEIG